jgi:hypothetical protein
MVKEVQYGSFFVDLSAEESAILTRASLLTLFLIVAIGLVLAKTYWLWTVGPWDLPTSAKAKSRIVPEGATTEAIPQTAAGTEMIISKNLFDPERGAGLTTAVEANSQAFQRVKSMVLLGTAIIGSNRFAILQDGATSPGAQGQSVVPMRVKLGDTVDGFRLSEVSEKRVIFNKGSATVEVSLDYFRRTDLAQPRGPVTGQTEATGQAGTPRVTAPRPPGPRVIPALPRRERLPASPGASQDR